MYGYTDPDYDRKMGLITYSDDGNPVCAPDDDETMSPLLALMREAREEEERRRPRPRQPADKSVCRGIPALARATGYSRDRLYAMFKAGKLPHFKAGQKGLIFDVSRVNEILAEMAVQADVTGGIGAPCPSRWAGRESGVAH